MLNSVNRVCEQDAMEKIVILLICCEKKKYCRVSVTVKKTHQNGQQERHDGSPLHMAVQKRT
jgi:hypothetical protein